jgi:hypothetical protein
MPSFNPNNPTALHYATIVRKGAATGTKRTDSEEKKAARRAELIATMEKVVAPEQDGRYAQAQFTGTPTADKPFAIYTTTIYPSGRYHCECGAFKRDGALRQGRPCKHATALARIVLHDNGVTCEAFTDPRQA